MGIAERKERQRAELREQILGAARRIVLDEGFEALTMRKIANEIEYSAATIYLYFENREAIGHQLCAEAFEHLLSYMTAVAAEPDPVLRLSAIGRAYARYGFENPEEYRLLFMTDSAFMEEVFGPEHEGVDAGQRAFDFLADTVRAAQATGRIVDRDPTLIAEMLWTSTHGIVSLALTCKMVIESPIEQLVDAMGAALLRGLTPEPVGERAAI